jgi:hypothetical protein
LLSLAIGTVFRISYKTNWCLWDSSPPGGGTEKVCQWLILAWKFILYFLCVRISEESCFIELLV